MSFNIIVPLPKISDNSSIKVRKKVGLWMIPRRHWYLLLARFSNKEILTWLTKKGKQNIMWQRKPSLLLFQKKRRLTQFKKQRNHKHTIK